MKELRVILLVTLGVILSVFLLFQWALSAWSDGELQEEQERVEGNLLYNFKTHPDAFRKVHELSLDFPNIHQLQFFEDGRISFYYKHIRPKKNTSDYPFELELNDTTNLEYAFVGSDTLITEWYGKNIRTNNWVIYFTGQLDHPDLASIFELMHTSKEQISLLEEALNEAQVDVHERTSGYTKNSSMVTFGVYSLLASMDYIIPINDELDVSNYTQLNEHYFYGHAPTFWSFEAD